MRIYFHFKPFFLALTVVSLWSTVNQSLSVAADKANPQERNWRSLFADDMEQGIGGWSEIGHADFSTDDKAAHRGKKSARIIVEKAAYQQLRRKTKERVFPGDRFRASIWVRTHEVTGKTGAYMFIEFLQQGRSLAILHSRVDPSNGRNEWDLLTVQGTAPDQCDSVRMGAVLHAKGTAWFDDAKLETDGPPPGERVAEKMRIHVNPQKVINPDFIGFGFHVFFPMHVKSLTPRIRNEVLYKRWKELRPSFARLTHLWSRGKEGFSELAAAIQMMKETDTEIYLTTWDPKGVPPGPQREAYARQVADMLKQLHIKGGTNLRWYCVANELSLNGEVGVGKELTGWASLRPHKGVFKDYHQLFHIELKKRNLEIGLLAMDASPNLGVAESHWARQHMDDITAAFGGHHYINNHGLDDLGFYGWFLNLCRSSTAVSSEKPYIIGEFGAKQYRGSRYGFKKWDGCAYYDTKQEPKVAIQIAEAVLAAVNGGIDATAYWTFSDFPDEYSPDKRYTNKWGTSRWSGGDHSTREIHYGLALLSRYLRGPCEILSTLSSDPMLRTASVRRGTNTFSVVVINRNNFEAPVRIDLGSTPKKPFRKYIFNPSNPPLHPFGDLPTADALLRATEGIITDRLQPLSFVVYTTDYDDTAPASVANVRSENADGKRIVRWSPSDEDDFCYYRVFADGKQVGSTVATYMLLPDGVKGKVTVRSVDNSGNVSR